MDKTPEEIEDELYFGEPDLKTIGAWIAVNALVGIGILTTLIYFAIKIIKS